MMLDLQGGSDRCAVVEKQQPHMHAGHWAYEYKTVEALAWLNAESWYHRKAHMQCANPDLCHKR